MYSLIIDYPVTVTIVLVAFLLWLMNTLSEAIKKDTPGGYAVAIGGSLLVLAFVIYLWVETAQYLRG